MSRDTEFSCFKFRRVRTRSIFIFGLISIVTFGFGFSATADSGYATVFDVRRSLAMEPNEPVIHDFYVSAGTSAGIKVGSYLTVVREIPVHDPIQNKQQGMLNVTVGYLKVVHTEKNLAVARLAGELTNAQRPVLEFEALMIGDKVDLGSMTTKAPVKALKADLSQPSTDANPAASEVPVLTPIDPRNEVQKSSGVNSALAPTEQAT